HDWRLWSDSCRHDVGWNSASHRQTDEIEQAGAGACERSLSKTRKQAQTYEVSDQDGYSSTGFRPSAEPGWHSSGSKDATVRHNPVLSTGCAFRDEGDIPRQHDSLLGIIPYDPPQGGGNQDYRDH